MDVLRARVVSDERSGPVPCGPEPVGVSDDVADDSRGAADE